MLSLPSLNPVNICVHVYNCGEICSCSVVVVRSAGEVWLLLDLLWQCGCGEIYCGSVVVVGSAVAVWLW